MATCPEDCPKCCAGGYARGCMRGPLAQIVSFSFRGPLKSQWALQAFEDTLLGMRGPREWRTPQSGSRQAVWKSMLVQNGYARGYAHYIYIYTFVHISARVCARVCASYIYVLSRKLAHKWLGMREGMRAIYIYI